jgi:signal peptidase I
LNIFQAKVLQVSVKTPTKPQVRKFWKEQIRPLLLMALVLFAFRSAVADWYDVPSGSMRPTILEGDRVFVHKTAYDLKVPFTTWHLAEWGNPQRGDIVVCYSPADGKRLVKRVVAVPGDRVELAGSHLLVNGVAAEYAPLAAKVTQDLPAQEIPYYQFAEETVTGRSHPVMFIPSVQSRSSFAEQTVPAGQYFMMGDNRDNSLDSRYFGFVPRQEIVGEAVGVAMSFDKTKSFSPRWGRFFSKLP